MSAAEWYFAVKNQRYGPVTLEELQAKAVHQEIKPTDLVWKPGFAAWTPAQQVPGIFLDRTMMGEVAATAHPAAAAIPREYEQTEVSSPIAAPATAKDILEATAVQKPQPNEEERLYLTELPGAEPRAFVDSLTGEALPPHSLQNRRTAPPAAAGPGGFAWRWNLRDVSVSDPERSLCLSSGVEDPRIQQYLAWRRGLLQLLAIPAVLCVIFGLLAVAQQEGRTGFGRMIGFLQIVPLIAMPVVILWATAAWWQWNLSRSVLLNGWLIAWSLPLLLGLLPPDWQVAPTSFDALPLWGWALFLYALPALWTVLPGATRAALRLKELVPAATFVGWAVVSLAAAHVLMTAALVLALQASVGNLVFALMGLCFLIAPFAFLWKAPLLLKPMSGETEKTEMALAQLLHLGLTAAGLVLLFLFVFTAEFAGKRLVGFEEATSWVRPWNGRFLLLPFELFTRSLLTTLVAADLLLLINLRFRKLQRQEQGTPESQGVEVFLDKVEQDIHR